MNRGLWWLYSGITLLAFDLVIVIFGKPGWPAGVGVFAASAGAVSAVASAIATTRAQQTSAATERIAVEVAQAGQRATEALSRSVLPRIIDGDIVAIEADRLIVLALKAFGMQGHPRWLSVTLSYADGRQRVVTDTQPGYAAAFILARYAPENWPRFDETKRGPDGGIDDPDYESSLTAMKTAALDGVDSLTVRLEDQLGLRTWEAGLAVTHGFFNLSSDFVNNPLRPVG